MDGQMARHTSRYGQTEQTSRYGQTKRQMLRQVQSLSREAQFKEVPASHQVVMPFSPTSKAATTLTFLIMTETATIKFWNIRVSH